MWFAFSLIVMLAWGLADLFYKKGADTKDKYSHLKTAMMVGFVMGIHAVVLLICTDMNYNLINLLRYLPVSLCYMLSMTVGYFGLRYLELSISSPIQNSSGAVSCILLLIFLGKQIDLLSAAAVICISVGVFLLGVFEREKNASAIDVPEDRKYKKGFVALLFPLLYCVIDSLGTFLDGYYLDDINSTFLIDVTEDTFENVANTSYELSFLFAAIVIFIYLYVIKKEKLRFSSEKNRGIAALLETGGQFAYVYAMSGNAVVAAPMVGSYCIVSVILSRIFIKEKLSKKQYPVIALVIIGIIILGISEGLSE